MGPPGPYPAPPASAARIPADGKSSEVPPLIGRRLFLSCLLDLIYGVGKGGGGTRLADQEGHFGGVPAFVENLIVDLADHPVVNSPGAAADRLLEPRLAEGVRGVQQLEKLSSGLEGLVNPGHALESFKIGEAAALVYDGIVIKERLQADGLNIQNLGKILQAGD